jgi:hypothetical protein
MLGRIASDLALPQQKTVEIAQSRQVAGNGAAPKTAPVQGIKVAENRICMIIRKIGIMLALKIGLVALQIPSVRFERIAS